jgi:dihydroxy-acid dehydratase
MDEQKLRSQGWFSRQGKDGFIYRAWMKTIQVLQSSF